jgi:F0F1-type ATP synthase assembly protein I
MSDDKRNQGSAIGIGSSAAAAFGLFSFIGYYLDQKYQTKPLWLLVGIFLAFIWIFYEVWKVVRKNGKE